MSIGFTTCTYAMNGLSSLYHKRVNINRMEVLLGSLSWSDLQRTSDSLSRLKKGLSTVKAVRRLLDSAEAEKLTTLIATGVDLFKVTNDKPSVIATMTEAVGLVANCCFLDSEMSMFVKNHKLLGVFINLVPVSAKLDSNLFTAVLRCLGNLVLRKECAVGILQSSYHAVDTIIERMASTEATEKVESLGIRFLSNFTLNGLSFANFLLKKNAVATLGKIFLSPTANEHTKEKILFVLNTFAHCSKAELANQLHQIDFLPSLMTLLSSKGSVRSQELAEKLFDKFSDVSTLKVELVRLGALEYLTSGITSNPVDLNKRQSYLFQLAKYCDHAFCRVKIREANVIPVLVEEFIKATPCSEVTWRLADAFKCFLHDPLGLQLMLDSNGFIPALFQQIQQYIQWNRCPHPVPKGNLSGNVALMLNSTMVESINTDETTSTESQSIRPPNSPTYEAFEQEETESQRPNDLLNTSWPLCKNFAEDFDVGIQFPSSSPGPSWSPSYTNGSFSSLSPRSIPSPNMSPGREFSGGGDSVGDYRYPVAFSPSIIPEWTVDDPTATNLIADYLDKQTFPKTASIETPTDGDTSGAAEPPFKRPRKVEFDVPSICPCLLPAATSGPIDYPKSTVAAVLDFISYWSNNATFSHFLVKTDVVETLLKYIQVCCDPYRKSLRILVRIVQDPRYKEELLAMQFHRLVKRNLCYMPRKSVQLCPINHTVSRAECWRCQRNCKLGCSVFNALQVSADDNDYLKGVLAHQLMSKSSLDRVKAAIAVGYIVRNESRQYRLMMDYRALNVLLDFIMGDLDVETEDTELQADSIDAFYLSLNKSRLESELRSVTDSYWSGPTDCQYKVIMKDQTDFVSFVCPGDQVVPVVMSRSKLTEISPVYAAMLRGGFSEAQQESITVTQSRDAFLYFLHFLCGCRNCATLRVIQLNDVDVLQLINMANLHMLPPLATQMVFKHLHPVINEHNAIDFLITGVIHENVKLQRVTFASAMLTLNEQDVAGDKLVAFLHQIAELGHYNSFIEIFRSLHH